MEPRSLDDRVLASVCGAAGRLFELAVDDLVDLDEIELTGDQIHLSGYHRDGHIRQLVSCLTLSTTSAKLLAAALLAAVERREAGS